VFAGALLVITPLELRTTNFFANGQAILVLGAALAAVAAGIGYWGPKMTGGHLADGIGKLNVLVMLGGGILGGVSLCVVGFATRFSGLSSAQDTLVVISVAGSALFAIGCVLVILGLASGARKGAPEAGDDAWGTGQTLEWACPSPPPTGNFGDLAVVRSPEPLLDEEA
jgi:cytochrome c oxidase subunit 1